MWWRIKLVAKRLVLLSGLVLGLGFVGCGYTLSHRLKSQFTNSRGLFVPVFENKTDETGAERVFTSAMIRELQSRHEVVLKSREDGAMELRGVVEAISINPTAFTVGGFNGLQGYRRTPSEMGVNVTLSFAIVEPKTKNVVWAKTLFGFRRIDMPLNRTYDYQAPSSFGLLAQSTWESLYDDIAGDIMRDLYDEMVEWF